ncbi:MAG: glycosyltransferase [Alistipes sp.]|nr:glycosyltransferase [Alistipes sp.]
MKVLHVITSLHTGGAEKLMADLLPRFRQEGMEVDLLLFDGADTPFKRQLLAAGVRIYELGQTGCVYNPLHILRLIPYLKKYDVVHTHNTAPQLFAAVASLFVAIRLVTTEHSTLNRRRAWKWFRWVDRWMYGRYARIICISDKAETNLRRHLALPQDDSICTICNGIDVARFACAAPCGVLKSEGADLVAVMMVAGFRYQKDQDTVIRAMSLLPERFHLYLVGDGERREECEKLCRERKVADRVHFLGIRTDIPELLKSADVVVMSSHLEGFGLAAVEGMAAGKPVVASDVDGLREVVMGAGLLFEKGNCTRLAETIESLIHNRDLYCHVVSKCEARASEYDISKMVHGYRLVYESVARV